MKKITGKLVICLNSFFTLVSVYDYFPKSRYKLISRSYVYNYAKDIALVILYDVRKNRIEFELRKRGGACDDVFLDIF